MRKLLLILVIGFIFSYSTKEPEICCTIIDAHLDLMITDKSGRNLLEPETKLAVITYDKIEGEWVISRNQPFLVQREDGNYLRVFANLENPEKEISELKLQFEKEDFAILKTQFERSGSNIFVNRVWYNGELKWEQDSLTERKFEVLKN